jgi:hypothetical protein
MNTKENYRSLTGQTLMLLLFWMFFVVLIAGVLIYFVYERAHVNGQVIGDGTHTYNYWLAQYNSSTSTADQKAAALDQLVTVRYPIIDFSLLSFNFLTFDDSSTVNKADLFTNRQNSINSAYSYLFITFVIALTGVIMYLVAVIKTFFIARANKKMGLYSREYDAVQLIKNKIYLSFVLNLAVIFSFFNFLSTLISALYGIFLVIISLVWRKYSALVLPPKWWRTPIFTLLISTVIYQNAYTLAKSLFMHYFSVDIDLIVSIIFPIGTTAVIITLFIKNIYSSKVSVVSAKLKQMILEATRLDNYYEVKGEASLDDYKFVSELPIVFATNIHALDENDERKLLKAIFTLIREIKAAPVSDEQKKCMLYHLFVNVKELGQLESLYHSIKKISAIKKGTPIDPTIETKPQ